MTPAIPKERLDCSELELTRLKNALQSSGVELEHEQDGSGHSEEGKLCPRNSRIQREQARSLDVKLQRWVWNKDSSSSGISAPPYRYPIRLTATSATWKETAGNKPWLRLFQQTPSQSHFPPKRSSAVFVNDSAAVSEHMDAGSEAALRGTGRPARNVHIHRVLTPNLQYVQEDPDALARRRQQWYRRYTSGPLNAASHRLSPGLRPIQD
ncbi:hypothetical protein K490DRAFT_57874 [Saccharata proteae CBS 121410]|uniref:Uncharacterized protein n=1 Tax=Saccharata proteae CBS 121410 TaxID=1314787 RepID=A0A9P4HTG8_9PEZI|nr:hypothetical protein K490DRAFT_57874 [Saccharata proteae CBS 121410]